jgi:ADP-ribose pyrophosphatase YjhB (NUDIX family)
MCNIRRGVESFKLDEIIEEHTFEERKITVTWRGSTFIPPRYLIRQASGICITDEGLIVLVTGDGESWSLPGGHPENDETIKDAFIREVREEACAIVTHLIYLGVSEVKDPGNPEGLTINYQARFWARVRLDEFKPEYETTGRKLVMPGNLMPTLNWYPAGIIGIILKAALECEQRYKLKAD